MDAAAPSSATLAEPAPSSRQSYRRLLGYLRPYRTAVSLAVACSTLAAAAAALYAYLLGPMMKAVLTGSAAQLGPLTLSPEDLRLRLPLLLVGIATAKAAAQWVQGGLMQVAGQGVMSDLRVELYRRVLSLPPRYFERRHSGELLSRFSSDVAQVEFSVTQALGSYVKDALQVLALLGVCLALDPRLFLLSFVVLPAAALPVSRFARALKNVARRTQGSLGRLTELAAEQLHNLPVLLSYGGRDRALAQFDAEQAHYLSEMKRSLTLRGGFTPALEILGVVGVALCLGVGAQAVLAEPPLAAKLLSFLAAALLMYQPLKALSGTFGLVAQGMGSAGRLFELIDANQGADPGAGEQVLDEGQPAAPLARALRFEAVELSYDGERLALAGLDLEVPAGKRVALVGASGAGKTTVFSSLLRFAAPRAGRILWDGVELRSLRPSSLRAQITWVPQEPVLFSGTVRENLSLGRPGAPEDELWEALRRAHAEAFVREFPRGLEEPMGERGSRLSGGQRQRLAIARAFLKKPSVLLLDEPTSALDAASEREVQAGLAELMSGRTTLIIAHRLSTVREADLLYVLEGGRVVERGTHAELLARGGRYALFIREADFASPPCPRDLAPVGADPDLRSG